jgi:hypothetical protein
MATGRDLCALAGACGIEVADLLPQELVDSLADRPLRDSLDDAMTRFLAVPNLESTGLGASKGLQHPDEFWREHP